MSLRTRLLAGLAALILAAIGSSGWVLLTIARARLAGAEERQARFVGQEALRLLRSSYDPSQPLETPLNRARLDATARGLLA